MNTYLVKWPDGSVSVVQAYDETDLYVRLDVEGDPSCAIIKKIVGDGLFYLTFNIAKQGEEQFIDADLCEEWDDVKLRKFTFRKDMFIKYLARITNRTVKSIKDLQQNKVQEIKDGLGLE
jgi:hypothetical protein